MKSFFHTRAVFRTGVSGVSSHSSSQEGTRNHGRMEQSSMESSGMQTQWCWSSGMNGKRRKFLAEKADNSGVTAGTSAAGWLAGHLTLVKRNQLRIWSGSGLLSIAVENPVYITGIMLWCTASDIIWKYSSRFNSQPWLKYCHNCRRSVFTFSSKILAGELSVVHAHWSPLSFINERGDYLLLVIWSHRWQR